MTAFVAACAAFASAVTAVTALVRALRTQSNLDAHVNDPGAHQ